MRKLRVLLAGLLFFLSPGPAAWAQVARSAPVRIGTLAPGVVAPAVLPSAAPASASLGLSPALTLTTPLVPALSRPQVRPAAAPAAAAAAALPAQALAAPAASPSRAAARPGAALSSPAPRQAPNGAKETLAVGAESVGRSRSQGGLRAALDGLFSGSRSRPEALNDVAVTAEPPLGLFRPGLSSARTPASKPPEAVAPPAADAPNKKALAGLFTSRTVSIASFILTSIAYPFLAVPAVGWAGYGALMAFGPLAAVATGPLNGLIAQRLSARDGMAVNAGIRAVLSLVLPVAAGLGFLNFWTLLAASVANGWIMNSVMTTEGTYLKKLATEKHLGTVNGFAWMNYLAVQVVLGLIVGVGSIVDQWDPSAAFYISAAVHALVVLPILWLTMPKLAPQRAARPADVPAQGLASRLLPWLRSNVLPLAGVAAGVGGYLAFSTTLPLVAAILYWVSRTQSFKDVWNGASAADPAKAKVGRRAMLYLALAALFMFPLQYFVLPATAAAIAGAAGKGLLLGQLMGALFLGNLVSVAARAKLPDITLPGGRRMKATTLVRGAVVALAAGWSLASLAPWSLPVAALVAAAAAGLIGLAGRLSDTGWLKLMGPGFAAMALPYAVWSLGLLPGVGVSAALMVSLLVAGMVYGPAFVTLNTYFQRWASPDRMGPAIGAQGSFFNAAVSIGYGLVALAAAAAPLPALLGVLTLAYAAGGVLFWLAPRLLPGLPAGFLQAPAPKG